MNILIVSAHPEPTSLTNALRREALEQLRADGHDVRLSDLYAAKWKAIIDREDFPNLPPAKRLQVAAASGEAFAAGAMTADVAHEQARLLWADALLFPINHGVLFCTGYEVLPLFVVYHADRLGDDAFRKTADALRDRMRTLFTASPIPFGHQNGGDYIIPSMQLRPEAAAPELTGFVAHVRRRRSAIGQPTPSQHINQQDEKI